MDDTDIVDKWCWEVCDAMYNALPGQDLEENNYPVHWWAGKNINVYAVLVTKAEYEAHKGVDARDGRLYTCLLYTSPSPRDGLLSRMPSSA